MSGTHTRRPGSPTPHGRRRDCGDGGKARFARYRETLRTTRLVGRGIVCSLKESLRRSLPRHRIPHQSRIILGAQYAFLRHGGIYLVRWGSTSKTKVKTKSWVGTTPPPAGRPRAQAKERAGRNTLSLIVRRCVPAGYSSIGLVATRARLRFAGTLRLPRTSRVATQNRNFLLCWEAELSTLP
jgi:hypothetical protein